MNGLNSWSENLMYERDRCLESLRELVSIHIYGWEKSWLRRMEGKDLYHEELYWCDDRGLSREGENHPAFNFTFDECMNSLKHGETKTYKLIENGDDKNE